MNKPDVTIVDKFVEQIGTTPDKVLDILQAIQLQFGYLPQEALERVCEITEITPVSITGVSTFYDMFRHKPAGRHIIRICVGTACHVKGAEQVYDAFRRRLRIVEGKDTDSNGLFTIEKVACLGCCTLAPAVQIGGVTYGHLSPDTVSTVIDDFMEQEQAKTAGLHKAEKPHEDQIAVQGEIRVGLGSCCVARGSGKLNQAIRLALEETGINAAVKQVGCVGMCYQTPLLEVVMPGEKSYLYTTVKPEEAKIILKKHFKMPGITKRISVSVSDMLDKFASGNATESVRSYPVNVRDPVISDFLDKQKHIATENYGDIAPVDIDEYLSNGGFQALQKCLSDLKPQQIISEIEKSGLRGRGGAGFLTYLKWSAVHKNKSSGKYVICNGDEGDPGAFMDRMLMESYPFRIIEGVIIAAYAVGANKGYFYIRAEYPLAIQRMAQAMEHCRERGLLGKNISGSDFSFELKIVPGAGAFVCGEESALMASIEGKRGMPRLRPPYPAEQGLWGKPTLINNVETYAMVSWIIRNSGNAFAQLGT
ncbi:MAG: proton-conducting membrane transporter, partial [Candidatus Brocadiia bacterium]